jgi:hypothetical protein
MNLLVSHTVKKAAGHNGKWRKNLPLAVLVLRHALPWLESDNFQQGPANSAVSKRLVAVFFEIEPLILILNLKETS